MGMTQCRRHGLSFLNHVCEHLDEALQKGTALPAFAEYPLAAPVPPPGDIWIRLCFCHACVASRGLPVPVRTISDDEQENEYRDRLETQPVCARCFQERKAASSG